MSFENSAPFEGRPSENFAGGFDVDFSFESDLNAPVEAMDRVARCMRDLDWPEDETDAFSGAVEEAVTNAVVHGNLGIRHEEGEDIEGYTRRIREASGGDAGKKKVEVTVEARMNDIVVKVKGGGDYVMEIDERDDPTSEGRIILPHGRGQLLIFNGCNEVMSYPGEIVLIKHRGGAAEGA